VWAPHHVAHRDRAWRRFELVKNTFVSVVSLLTLAWFGGAVAATEPERAGAQVDVPVAVGSFPQEVRTFYGTAEGLPSADVLDVSVGPDGVVYAATTQGLATLQDGTVRVWKATQGHVVSSVAVTTAGQVFAVVGDRVQQLSLDATSAKVLDSPDLRTPSLRVLAAGPVLLVCAGGRVQAWDVSPLGQRTARRQWSVPGKTLCAAWQGQQVAIGSDQGLTVSRGETLEGVFPACGNRRWAPAPVRGVTFDRRGRLWAVSPQGVMCYDKEWTLYAGPDGLPCSDLTSLAATEDGAIWLGTSRGAIRFDGQQWYYRQGRRWLPDDRVRAVAADAQGGAWVATAGGLAHLHFLPMTLADKAKFFEEEIDKYHRRTEWGYVLDVAVATPGQKMDVRQSDSDNDGLWTSMYGAGECFAYAATRDPAARRRAQQAFEALRFLQRAPAGSPQEPPAGFVARTVIPTTEPDPNLRPAYTLQGQIQNQARDALWRAYEPRWPRSQDGKYFWKSDTSSDELDGHYYFYPLYYDLVAESEEEKAAVRDVVRQLTDHLLAHNYRLVDHAGVTRWGDYSPETLNADPLWFNERGLKSISMLAYLNVAHHMTGDEKYREHSRRLREDHHYLQNALWGEYQRGIGSGNQSDDEMFMMCYYNLIKYEPDPTLKSWYLVSFANWWRLEEPEMNPLFNFSFAALARGQSVTIQWGTFDLSPWPSWLADSIATLKRFPLDRFNWAHQNSHREDLVGLPVQGADALDDPGTRRRGYRVNGKVVPVDERHFNHWNHDPWTLDSGGDGRGLADGAVYTLAYYLGLYHGFIAVDAAASP
jgi:hypothetical protein